MHHLAAVGFFFTAASLCASGIKSKCERAHQPLEQTAPDTAGRRQERDTTYSSCAAATFHFFFRLFFVARLAAAKRLASVSAVSGV